jgi:hypothetical protein
MSFNIIMHLNFRYQQHRQFVHKNIFMELYHLLILNDLMCRLVEGILLLILMGFISWLCKLIDREEGVMGWKVRSITYLNYKF